MNDLCRSTECRRGECRGAALFGFLDDRIIRQDDNRLGLAGDDLIY